MDANDRLERLADLCRVAEMSWQVAAAALARLVVQETETAQEVRNLARQLESSNAIGGTDFQLAGGGLARTRWIERELARLNGNRARLKAEIAQARADLRLSFGRMAAARALAGRDASK